MDDGAGRVVGDLESGARLEALPMDVAQADHRCSGRRVDQRGDEANSLAIPEQLGPGGRLGGSEDQSGQLRLT